MFWNWIAKAARWLFRNREEIAETAEELLDLSRLDWRPDPERVTFCPVCKKEIPIELASRAGKRYYRWKCDACGASRNWN